MKLILKYGRTAAFAAGALSVLSFAPHYFIAAAFIGFSVLLFLLLNAASKKQAFLLGYCFGFAHFAFGFSWIGNALLIDAQQFGWLYPLVLLSSGAFFGLFFAFPSLMTFWARQPWQKWLVLSAGVVVFEWLRSFLFTGFPWNLTGYTLAFSDEMIQGAAWGGVYFLSLAAVLGYSVLGLWLNDRHLKVFLSAAGGIILVIAVLWGSGYLRLAAAESAESDIVVRIVQPSIPQTMKWSREALEDNFKTYVNMTGKKGNLRPDLIVWGETASPFMLDVDEEHLQQLLPVIPQGSFLAAGMITYQPVKGRYLPHNSMAVINSDGQIVDYYHKSHLVPFGEYIPFRDYLPAFIRPVANAIGTFGRGSGPKLIAAGQLPAFGAIICYEVIFPHQVVDENARPDFLINLTNDGWYGDSAGPYQHWAATKMRAVEEGIAIIRAANNGISGMITAYGQEKAVLLLNDKGIVDVRLNKPLLHPTLYSRLGNGVSLTFCLILLFLGVIKVESRRLTAG